MYKTYRECLGKYPNILGILDLLSVLLIVYALGRLFFIKDVADSYEIIILFTVLGSLFFPFLLPSYIEMIKDEWNIISSPNKKCYMKFLGLMSILGFTLVIIFSFFIFLLPWWLRMKYILEIPFIKPYFSSESVAYFQSLESFPLWSIGIMFLTVHFVSFCKDNKFM